VRDTNSSIPGLFGTPLMAAAFHLPFCHLSGRWRGMGGFLQMARFASQSRPGNQSTALIVISVYESFPMVVSPLEGVTNEHFAEYYFLSCI